ncbi:hypothetical protein [Candidatus Enterococcus leclercqii]|uniref:hypothetical protein n=1 Tax=Candidatus Enterococcus leclercqii TaxID=1857218 RepID=UPI00137A6BD8|nr:hypothetical protein [Enterococcus sp. CU9D]KAF1291070.1 hypothetical protein BAU14_10795 [Enterococcus sp. CU9D]
MIDLTEKEAKYLSTLLKNETTRNQAIMKKNPALKGFFAENNSLNKVIGTKLTKSLKRRN